MTVDPKIARDSSGRPIPCSQWAHKECPTCKHREQVACPEPAVGKYTDYDGYENRSYWMCASHRPGPRRGMIGKE